MPTPEQNEPLEKFVERCIPVVIEDGTAADPEQAYAVCRSMWEQSQAGGEKAGAPYKVITKREADGDHPASHYLVIEDPESPSTWHLRVKDLDGNLDHRLMGAAWAALHEGYRGNRYEGPDKQAALAKLKKLYDQEDMPYPGGKSTEIKLLDQIGDIALIGGYGVKFGDQDLERETFLKPPGTDYMLDLVPKKLVTYDHRQREQIKHYLGRTVQEEIDDLGIWVESELKRSTAYVNQVLELIKRGRIGYSSGSVPHLVEKLEGTIKQWPIVEYALTVTPAEPRLLGVAQLKALARVDPDLKVFLPWGPRGSRAGAMEDRARLAKIHAKILTLEDLP